MSEKGFEKPQKITEKTMTSKIANTAYEALQALADNNASDEQINWLIDTLDPVLIKNLSQLYAHLDEMKVLEKLIKRKSLPPDFF